MLQSDTCARSAILSFIAGAIVAGLTSSAFGEAPNATTDWADFERLVQPFFAKHCLECHADKKSGGVRLDVFRDDAGLTKGLTTLERAALLLRKGAMPPPKKPRPAAATVQVVADWLDRLVERREARPRPVLVRRLNRTEYDNTVRDLLGVGFKPADDFPADVPAHGFDTVAGTLSVSPVLVEKYLEAAEKVARTAIFGPAPMKLQRTAHQPYFIADAFSKNMGVKFDYDETGMSLPSALHVVQRFPVDAEYAFRAILRGIRPAGSNPVELAFWLDGKRVHETRIEVPTKIELGRRPGELNGRWAEFRMPVSAGEHWLSVSILRMYEGLPPAYGGPKPAKTELGLDRATDAFFPMYLDVVGPYKQATGPSWDSGSKVFGPAPRVLDATRIREIIRDLVRRAYRRPVRDAEVDDLVKLVEVVRKDGESVPEGLCLAIQRMLISPHFLFRVEKAAAPGKTESLTPHEVATRLSYFLWSSMPDDELSRCADDGSLDRADVLEAQVRRMLRDPKASALVENFGGQWLQTRSLESHTPDRNKFGEFTDYTRMSMKKETDLFLEHMIREDRPILEFLDADYTFLNQRLAEFYGIAGVQGHAFRKIDLKGSRRGGVWTHASVLTVSSYANRTSPVLRGKWILENLLNAPPPPPPADVPSIDETAVGTSVSLREQYEKHRSNATCAACHARMDPLGFALENFDAIGRWRTKDGNFAIDPAGSLPDGRSFKSHEDLRALLRADAGAFAECLVEKLMVYALGRGPVRADKKTVHDIAESLARDEYRFSRLILGIVSSPPFRMRSPGTS